MLANFAGENKPLIEASLVGETTPGGTGDCAAPKLLSHAQRLNLRPIALTEFWLGSSAKFREGDSYAACAERCQLILGYMLCGLVAD